MADVGQKKWRDAANKAYCALLKARTYDLSEIQLQATLAELRDVLAEAYDEEPQETQDRYESYLTNK